MNKSDLRESSNIDEMSSFLKKSILNKSVFFFWQSNDQEKVVSSGKITNQFKSKQSLIVDFLFETTEKIIQKKNLFIMCPKSKILFKGRIKVISKTKLRVIIYDKFYLKEQREIKRIDLRDSDFTANIDRIIEQKNMTKNEHVHLKDISDNGFGFYITPNRAIFFQPESKITFHSVQSLKLDIPVTGIIQHVTPVKAEYELNNKLLLVGVKFDTPYPNIDTLIQNVQLREAL